ALFARLITPTALYVLCFDNQLHRTFQGGLDLGLQFLVGDAWIDLCQEVCCVALIVHGCEVAASLVQQARGGLLVTQDAANCLGEHLAMLALVGLMAAGEEGKTREAGDSSIALVHSSPKGAVAMLLLREIREAGVDYLLRVLGDQLAYVLLLFRRHL